MIGSGWCSQVRASSEFHFDALREVAACERQGSTVAESLVVLFRMGTPQTRRGQRGARRSTGQGSAEPLCTIIKGVNREVSERKADI